ncbi:hypothetical protein [Actinomadura macrotermitis]|nr:hypothetical protein [Actinomadura macrotermitis]
MITKSGVAAAAGRPSARTPGGTAGSTASWFGQEVIDPLRAV